jgi:electron transport complex protein RnfC
MKYRTFKKGGIHPHDHKITAEKSVQTAPLPEKVVVPFGQHIGAPAKPLVQRGDKVKVGTRIAEAASFISANVHSPVSGTVERLDQFIDASGYPRSAVVIQVEGDEWESSIKPGGDFLGPVPYSKEEILQKVADAGIVGAGGAAFPTQVKLSIPPKGPRVEYLIINAVECEPYLTADHRIMLERPLEVLQGIKVLQKALGVDHVLIGVEINKMDAIDLLVQKTLEDDEVTVVPLKVQYPQGAEKQLIEALIRKEVPSGKLPLETGSVVSNIGTALAVFEAVYWSKPFIERVMTVTGKELSKPGNFLVRVGTPVSDLIQLAGGLPENTGKVVLGGPMMGKAISDLSIPVTKGTSGILLLPEQESRRKTVENCIRCASCVRVCPMGLEPYLLEKLSEHLRFEESETADVMDCIECGACSYICPSARPLVDYIRVAKRQVGALRRERSLK